MPVTEQLRELKRQIDHLEMDDEKRALLDVLMVDIEAGVQDELDEGLVDQLEDKVSEFEADHPTVAAVIRDVINRLNSLGI